jgi:hypothetical protein
MAAERSARRGSLVYALCYLALCFPPRLFSRAWTTACFAAMAADYQVSYGPFAYNLAMQFRKPSTSVVPETMERQIHSTADRIADDDRAARAA